jgi:hypothetical protein
MNPTPQKPPRELFVYYYKKTGNIISVRESPTGVVLDPSTDEEVVFIERAYATRLEEALRLSEYALRDLLENGYLHAGHRSKKALADIERMLGEK